MRIETTHKQRDFDYLLVSIRRRWLSSPKGISKLAAYPTNEIWLLLN